MIPKLLKRHSNFRASAAYLLHDVGSTETSERVAWVETRNLPISPRLDDLRRGDIAWRLMAATALDQARIKERAWDQAQEKLPKGDRKPFRNVGRKSTDFVMHITLSWAEHEGENLTRADMLEAADSLLARLGEEPGKKGGRTKSNGKKSASRIATRRQFADEHQILIVCHSDKHPHIHILINRVQPEHGVMLPTSKEHLIMSRWAQEYEESRGEILVEQRRINNQRRDQGDHWSQGTKHKPRHLYELEASNDNGEEAERIKAEQKAMDHEMAKKSRAVRQKNKKLWQALQDLEQEKRDRIKAETDALIKAAHTVVRDRFAPAFQKLYHEQEADRAAFAITEQKLTGRISNAWKQVDWKGLLARHRRSQAMKEAFGLFAGGTHQRTEALRRRHEAQTVALEKKQTAELNAAAVPIRRAALARKKLAQGWYLARRQKVQWRVARRKAGLGDAWRNRHSQRREAWKQGRNRDDNQPQRQLPSGVQTITSNDQRDRAIADHKKRMALRQKQRQKRGHDEDRGR